MTGERTPLCDARARGAFIGLTRRHDRAHLTRAVLEGITIGLRASLGLIRDAGTTVSEATVVGGGTKSPLWMQMMADIMDATMILRDGADAGPALGGARLALIGACGQSVDQACAPGPEVARYTPEASAVAAYQSVIARFQALYPAIEAYCHQVAE